MRVCGDAGRGVSVSASYRVCEFLCYDALRTRFENPPSYTIRTGLNIGSFISNTRQHALVGLVFNISNTCPPAAFGRVSNILNIWTAGLRDGESAGLRGSGPACFRDCGFSCQRVCETFA